MMENEFELSSETFRWLYDFVEQAIRSGLDDHVNTLSEEICNELSRHNLIERSRGNDGDITWRGKVRLVESFVYDIMKGINLYGITRGIIYERAIDDGGIREDDERRIPMSDET